MICGMKEKYRFKPTIMKSQIQFGAYLGKMPICTNSICRKEYWKKQLRY